jgi:hypothetical protein
MISRRVYPDLVPPAGWLLIADLAGLPTGETVTKSDREIMEILEAYDSTGCAHSAAELVGCDPKTIRRYLALRETAYHTRPGIGAVGVQPRLKVRVVNVVDLMALPRPRDRPHGSNRPCSPTPSTSCSRFMATRAPSTGSSVAGPTPTGFWGSGFIEQGSTATTPFDLTIRNRASRYHLVMDAINARRRVPGGATELKAWCDRNSPSTTRTLSNTSRTSPSSRTGSLGDWAEKG